jgi:hypothetical protein
MSGVISFMRMGPLGRGTRSESPAGGALAPAAN